MAERALTCDPVSGINADDNHQHTAEGSSLMAHDRSPPAVIHRKYYKFRTRAFGTESQFYSISMYIRNAIITMSTIKI